MTLESVERLQSIPQSHPTTSNISNIPIQASIEALQAQIRVCRDLAIKVKNDELLMTAEESRLRDEIGRARSRLREIRSIVKEQIADDANHTNNDDDGGDSDDDDNDDDNDDDDNDDDDGTHHNNIVSWEKTQMELEEAEAGLNFVEKIRPSAKVPFLLKLSLGSAPFIMADLKQRLKYKTEYENFKLMATVTHFVVALLQLLMRRWWEGLLLVDTALNFFLLYTYATLTVRELILIANGSHIKPWWIVHHLICIGLTGVMLIWPASPAYHECRIPTYFFSCYIAAVQALQYRYQMSRLYVLRSLARIGPMQTTTESAQVHVKNNLAFLLPFLCLGFLFQAYCAWMFGSLYVKRAARGEWYPAVLSALFTLLVSGNILTTVMSIYSKFRPQMHTINNANPAYNQSVHLPQPSDSIHLMNGVESKKRV